MVKLTSLNLTLPFSQDCGFNHDTKALPMVNVKTFHLDIPSSMFAETWKEKDIVAHQISANRLGETLVPWLPKVDELHISTAIGHSFAIQYIQTLEHLTELHAKGSRRESITGVKRVLPGVEYIHTWHRSSILTAFIFPNAYHLDLNGAMDEWDRIDEPLTFYVGSWFNLTSLDVGGHDVDWRTISLPSVEKIVVGDRYPTRLKANNSLIRDLGSDLRIFSSLSHVGFRFIPEWDLLFIMLERRNFTTNANITPITTISLPSRLVNAIMKPLASRLGMKLTKRPSNFDLSSTSIAEAYFDRSL